MDLIPDFGRYAFTVWTCYGVTVFVLGTLIVRTLIQNRARKK